MRLASDERGQVLAMVAVAMLVLLGVAGLVVDVGRVMWAQKDLQAATDAAALAGAAYLPSTSAVTEAKLYSAGTGSKNSRTNLANVTVVSVSAKCLSTLTALGEACLAPADANAVQVQEQATVQLYFAGLFGYKTMTVTATSTASAVGGSPTPYNIAVILDTTLSMNTYDSDCGATQMSCALSGLQVLLQNLSPCARSHKTCTFTSGQATDSVDRVSLFTFPNLTTSTSAIDYECTGTPATVMPPTAASSGLPTAAAYSFPTALAGSYTTTSTSTAVPAGGTSQVTYQVTGFLSDYKTSATATTLNTSSILVKAAGGVSGCNGMTPSNYDGVYGTYYAGAIYAAESALMTEQAAFPGSQNAIILLSDGNATAPQNNGSYTVMGSPATSSGKYPSWVGECGQAVVAAQVVAAQGTQVYSVAYGSEPSGCTSDAGTGSYPNITPCATMAAIASAPQYFYSDYKQSGSGSTCTAGQPVTALKDIFQSISAQLSTARLIPNNTT